MFLSSYHPLSKLSAWLSPVLHLAIPLQSPASSLHSPLAPARMTNSFHVVTSKVHFSMFTFLDFSATHDTNIQLLAEVPFFSRLPTPPTVSLLTTPPIPHALAYLPSGPWITISCVCGFLHSVPATWYAFLLL